MFGREDRAQQGADLYAKVVHKQAGSEALAAEAAKGETSRILAAEDIRYKELLVAKEGDLLAAAQKNMIDFDPAQHVSPPSIAVLAKIDAAIQSVEDPRRYFPVFEKMSLGRQSYILQQLNSASVEHADIYSFTETLLSMLRTSNAYEPLIHGKPQRQFLRIEKPNGPKGRPATAGNEMLASLIVKVINDFDMPKSTSAKIVQEVVTEVLGVVMEGEHLARRRFAPTDGVIKKIVEKL